MFTESAPHKTYTFYWVLMSGHFHFQEEKNLSLKSPIEVDDNV
jgi:hypothetical protein